ncbi:DUF805 domain-containing protein [Pantoea anthophila]|uniref:DUF805 domain-containing protein n=1 Tax=Pantoea anthophila TaxID=470931 RepID=A0ABY2Z494_9GAMM|nr:DUF805 domain-containing protein [Pantoea anthophila]
MVFCRGCGKEIHVTAKACPQCGAPQTNQQIVTSENTGGAINQWYLGVLKKYAVFTGRARRKEYWMFTLFNILIAFLLGIVETVIGVGDILSNLYSLAVLIPGIAVGVRRLHDTDRSGWWLLLPIVNIVFLALEGQSGTNRFGSDPKEVA